MVDSEMNKTEIEKSKSFNDIFGGRKTGLLKKCSVLLVSPSRSLADPWFESNSDGT